MADMPLIGIRPDHWDIVQDILKKHVPQHEVWAFGSRAKWLAKAYSDLDLAIITEKALSLAVSASLSDDFSESDLPYKVDVVDWATTSEAFRKIIERDRVVVWEGRREESMVVGEWKTLLLEDCMAAIIDYRGKSPEKTTFGVPLVTAKIVKRGRIEKPEEFISEDDFDEWMQRGMPEPGDVVMTTEAPLGEVAQLDARKVALAQRVITLRGKSDVLDNTFLKFLLQSNPVQEELRSRATGTTVIGIRQSELRKISLKLPPLTEQKAIAHILGTLDDKIELNRRMNATLEAIAQALFKSWFVDFDPVRAKMEGRAPEGMDEATAALFPDSFQDSAIGPIPRGWEMRTADEISTVGIGKTPPRKEQHWFSEKSSDVPWISIRDLGNAGVFVLHTSEFLTAEAVEKFRIRRIPDNTVVLSFKLTMGRVAITDGEMLSNEAIAHFCLHPDTLFGYAYLYCYLKGFKYDQLGSTSSIATAINSNMVRSIQILVPSKGIAKEFETVANPMFDQMKAIQKQSRTLATLRDTLLPKLLSGELRVPVAKSSEDAA